MKIAARLILGGALTLMVAIQIQAADRTWSAAPTDGNWSAGANWGGTAPGNGDSLIFNASTQTALNNNYAALSVANITFGAAAPAYLIGGNPLTLTGNIINKSGVAQTITANLTGANLVLGDFTGALAAPVVLAGNNTFTGNTTLGNNAALRLDYSVNDTAKLAPGTLTINSGALTLAGGSAQETVTGLTVGGINSVARGYVRLDRDGGTASLFVNSTGAITRNSYTVLDVTQNNLLGGSAAAFPVINNIVAPWLTIGTGNTRNFAVRDGVTGMLKAYTGYSAFDGAVSYSVRNDLLTGSGVVALDGMALNSLKIDNTTGAAQTLALTGATGSGTLSLTSGGLLVTGSDDFTITGGKLKSALNVWNNAGELVLWNSNAGVLTVASALELSALTVAGDGVTRLAGANSINNTVSVWQGTVILDHDAALGTGALNGLQVGGGGTLDLNGHNVRVTAMYGDPSYGIITNSAAGAAADLKVGDHNGGAWSALSNKKLTGNLRLIVTGTNHDVWYVGNSIANTHTGGVVFMDNSLNSRIENTRFFGTGAVEFANGGFATINADASINNVANDIIISGTAGGQANRLLLQNNRFGSYGAWTGSGAITVTNNGNVWGELLLAGDMSNFTGTLNLVGQNNNVVRLIKSNATTVLDLSKATVILTAAGDGVTTKSTSMIMQDSLAASSTIKIGHLATYSTALGTAELGATGDAVLQANGNGAANLTYEIGALNASGTYAGRVINGWGNVHLTKVGTGTLALTNSLTYGGATTVSGGVLLVTGTAAMSKVGEVNASAIAVIIANTGGEFRYDSNQLLDRNITLSGGKLSYSGAQNLAGALTFNSGTLGGTNWGGTLAGLNISENRVIAPGNGIGTAVTGAQTWSDLGAYEFELSNAAGIAGTDWDLLEIGALTLDTIEFTIQLRDITLSGFDPTQNYSWDFAHFTTISELTAFAPAAFIVDAAGFQGGAYADTQFTVSLQNNALTLNYAAQIPEPSTWALMFTLRRQLKRKTI